MAFTLKITTDYVEICDACKKPASSQQPIVMMWGSTPTDRNFIQVHEACLIRRIEKEKAKP